MLFPIYQIKWCPIQQYCNFWLININVISMEQ